MVQVCTHLWAMQQLFFWRAFRCSQDAQLLVHKHMPRAGFLYEYGRPAGAARARVNRDSRNELMELHATQKVCHRRAGRPVPILCNRRFRKQDGKLKMGDGCQPAQVSVS